MKKRFAVLLAVLLAITCGACSRDTSGPAEASGEKPAEQAAEETKEGSAAGAALDAAFEAGQVVFEPKAFAKPDPATCRVIAPPEDAWRIIQGIRTDDEGNGDEATASAEISVSVEHAGRIRKTDTPTPVPEPAAMDEAAVREMLAKGELTICSYSPDGKHGIGYLVTDEITVPVAVSEDTAAIVYPSKSRGVEDTYGIEEKYYRRCWTTLRAGSFLGMGREGMIWSPGGRYCCGLNGEMIRSRIVLSNGGIPAIVDTQTGEMFLLDAYSGNFTEEDSGFMTEGFFSDDEQYFYGVFRGNSYSLLTTGWQYILIRYSLATYEAEPVQYLISDMRSVAMLADQRMLMLSDMIQRAKLSDDDRGYYTMMAYAKDGMIQESLVIPLLGNNGNHELVFSPASGTGLLLSSTKTIDTYKVARTAPDNQMVQPTIGMYGLSVIDPQKRLAESLNTIWMVFGGPDAPRISELETKQFATLQDTREFFFPSGGSDSGQDGEKTELPWTILEAELSPDGRYAALAAFSRREESPDGESRIRLLIVRLSDMKMIASDGLEAYMQADSSSLYYASKYSETHSLMNWSDAGLIIDIGTGTPVLWQLKGLN